MYLSKFQNMPSKSITGNKLLSELPFYNISIKKPIINKKLSIVIPFLKSFLKVANIMKHSKAFKNCACNYTVEVLIFQDSTSEFNIIKPCAKNILKGLLAEMRGFKCQITLQITFRKEIENNEVRIDKLDINYSLETYYQIIFSRVQKWLGYSSGWLIQSVDDDHYSNILFSVH